MAPSPYFPCAFNPPLTLNPTRRHRPAVHTSLTLRCSTPRTVPTHLHQKSTPTCLADRTRTSRRDQHDEHDEPDDSDGRPTYFATCARGLGDLLATELEATHINAEVLHIAASGVLFRGTEPGHLIAYRACLWLRTATRVLHRLAEVDVDAHMASAVPDAVYDAVKHGADWPSLLREGRASFSVQVRASASSGASERVLRMRAKDAVCDRLRDERCHMPERPDRHGAADVPLFMALHGGTLTLYADMAGDSLHKRGYRADGAVHRGALNETVAAGVLYRAGFRPDGTFGDISDVSIVDPMCGSGTLLLEAALLRTQAAVGLFRRAPFPFEHASDFDRAAFDEARQAAAAALRPEAIESLRLLGADVHRGALSLAQRDVEETRLKNAIELRHCDIRRLHLREAPTLVVSNPPWGRRLEEGDAWYDLGQFLREEAAGSTAVFLSGDATVTRELRMKARNRFPVRIGNVDCRVLVYDVLPKRETKELESPVPA